jgi:hypothetical protein
MYHLLVTVFDGVRPDDGVADLGQYKYPRRVPRGEVVPHVILFDKDRGVFGTPVARLQPRDEAL